LKYNPGCDVKNEVWGRNQNTSHFKVKEMWEREKRSVRSVANLYYKTSGNRLPRDQVRK